MEPPDLLTTFKEPLRSGEKRGEKGRRGGKRKTMKGTEKHPRNMSVYSVASVRSCYNVNGVVHRSVSAY